MSDLLEAWSAVSDPPVTHTGVDYFGPIMVNRGKKTRPAQEQTKDMVSSFLHV